MATTTSAIASKNGMYSKANPVDENALRGVRRSRFSFHFMTRRTRRWLLVQWVSVPVRAKADRQATAQANSSPEGTSGTNFQSLLSDYTTQSWLRRCA